MADRSIAPVDLDRAVEAGVIDRETADSLAAFASAGATPPAAGERFRIVSTFADIFLTVGLAMLTGGLAARALWWTPNPVIESLAFAALTWGLAEYVVRRKRMVLPGMVLATAFAVMLIVAIDRAGVFGWLVTDARDPAKRLDARILTQLAVGGVAAALAGGLFFARFRFPFALVVVVAGLAAMVIAGAEAAKLAPARWTSLGCGALTFIAAMICDMRDPRRERLVADCGFWLHVSAAPLVVHALFTGQLDGADAQTGALLTLGGLLLLTLVSLVVDRRALIVAALTYAGGLILYALRNKVGDGQALIATLAVLGGVVVGLGFAWVPLRRLVLRILPLGPLAKRLPPAVQTA